MKPNWADVDPAWSKFLTPELQGFICRTKILTGFSILLSMCPLLELQTLELSFLMSHLRSFCLIKYHVRFYPVCIWIGSGIAHASLNQKHFWKLNLDRSRGKPLPNLNQNWIPSRIQFIFWSFILLCPVPATYIYSNIWVAVKLRWWIDWKKCWTDVSAFTCLIWQHVEGFWLVQSAQAKAKELAAGWGWK